ncbi:MAG TPA: hemolysin-like protein [Rhodospirillaceae bacterium]|nr:hemolysin-like protein [Rhodospirillaceae bacterium]
MIINTDDLNSDNAPDQPQSVDANPIILRLAETPEEIIAAQRLRYKIFYEEFDIFPPEQVAAEQRDFDEYDEYADHLIVVDESISDPNDKIVGTYRLFRRDAMPTDLPFYSTQEFDIEPLIKNGGKLLELGRSCVLPEYRTKYVMQRLWQGIAEYLSVHQIDLMFGCASFQERDPHNIIDQLAYLHHYHSPPDDLCVKARPDCTIDLDFKSKEELDARRVFSDLPALIKGYLRLGAYIGHGAYADKSLHCIDVCIVLPTHKVTQKYKKHYDRKNSKK